MSKIIGNTTATPVPRSNWAQTEESKADFILKKPELGSLANKNIADKSDLSTSVQKSLDNADNAIKAIDTLADTVAESYETKLDASAKLVDAKAYSDANLEAAKAYTDAHNEDTANPHKVTIEQLGAAAQEHYHSYLSIKENNIELPFVDNWSSIAYASDRFITVAKGSNNSAYSTDGINWESSKLPSSANWSSVVVGDIVIAVTDNSNVIARRNSNIAWTTAYGQSSAGGCVVYSGNRWLFIGYQDVKYITSNTFTGSYTSVSLPYTSSKWIAANSLGSSKIVAIAPSTNKSIYSTNSGDSWSMVNLPVTSQWASIACWGSGYVAVGNNPNTIIYSNNGTSWTEAAVPVSAPWSAVASGYNKLVVAVAMDSSVAVYSTDGGATWNETTMPGAASWSSVAFGEGKFVAIAANSNIAAYSTDGISWTMLANKTIEQDGANITSDVKDAIMPTLVRGVDYWTEEDKAEIKSYVDDAILNGAW